jgi:hypothetical protein
MTDPTKPPSRKLPPAGNYTVGYKKPPSEHQFKSKSLSGIMLFFDRAFSA